MPHPGRPPTFDHVKQQSFLQLLSQGLTIREAARQVGVSPSTVFDRKKFSPAFAAACAEAKAQALPTLLEHIHSAGARSWRASAWLLERIRPDLFGRRVALGLDPARPKPPKPLPKSVMTDEMITDFIDSLRLVPEAQAFAKQKLAELEDQQRAWDAARTAYDEEIDRLGRPRDFYPLDYIPLPSCLNSTTTPDTSPLQPEAAEVLDPSPSAEPVRPTSTSVATVDAINCSLESNNSDNSPSLEKAQPQPPQPEPTTDHHENPEFPEF